MSVMRYSSMGISPTRIEEMVVTIVGVDLETSTIMCLDSFGNEFEIDGTVRPKGSGIPREGERWLLVRKSNRWVIETQIGAEHTPTITGSRSGMHPVAIQILDGLAKQGLVIDQTVAAPVVVPPDEPIYDPGDSPELGEDPDEPLPGDHEEWGGDFTPGEPIEEDGPPAKPAPPPRAPVTTKPVSKYTNQWKSMYATTFNVYKTLGARTAEADLRRLARTRTQLIGLQEAHGEDRNASFNRMKDIGWDFYRPKQGSMTDENTILWRTDDFSLLDKGVMLLSTVDVEGMPPRYLNWVKLTYKPANRVIYFMSTHLDPHLDTASGRPNPKYPVRVAQSLVHIEKIAQTMQSFGRRAPVITAGDFNISAPPDARTRYPRFPYARFGRVGTKSNWAYLGAPKGWAKNIDHIYLTRGTDWHMKFTHHWGFAGYASDHRPVMARLLIRAKT